MDCDSLVFAVGASHEGKAPTMSKLRNAGANTHKTASGIFERCRISVGRAAHRKVQASIGTRYRMSSRSFFASIVLRASSSLTSRASCAWRRSHPSRMRNGPVPYPCPRIASRSRQRTARAHATVQATVIRTRSDPKTGSSSPWAFGESNGRNATGAGVSNPPGSVAASRSCETLCDRADKQPADRARQIGMREDIIGEDSVM